MYVNKCTKCGCEFETKNPKRVICPNCLYPDKKMILSPTDSNGEEQKQGDVQQEQTPQEKPQQQHYNSYSAEAPQQQQYSSYSSGGGRPQGDYQRRDGGYQRRDYNRPQGDYQRRDGGYNRPQGDYQRRDGGYNRPQGGFNRPRFNNQRRPGGGMRPRPNRNKPLLVTREQLEQIELLYKAMLPLPNPDAHEVIGAKIGLEPRKVFFGMNLIRQKMMLPKLPFPKRKLAISPDQMFAIQNLYEPLLPLPPIGCHKIIAAQLKMDEWRVHVGIGLIRAKMGLDRWNPDRPDAPEEFKKAAQEAKLKEAEDKKTEEKAEKAPTEKEEKPKAKEEAKKEEEKTADVEGKAEKKPAKKTTRTRKTKKTEEEPKEETSSEVKE